MLSHIIVSNGSKREGGNDCIVRVPDVLGCLLDDSVGLVNSKRDFISAINSNDLHGDRVFCKD